MLEWAVGIRAAFPDAFRDLLNGNIHTAIVFGSDLKYAVCSVLSEILFGHSDIGP